MARVRTFVRIDGEIHGSIWMPAAHCYKPVRVRIEIKHRERYTVSGTAPDVRTAINGALRDGDFQGAKFTPETEISIERERWLAPGRVTLSGKRAGDAISSDAPMYYKRSRALDVPKLGTLYVADCAGHYSSGDGDE